MNKFIVLMTCATSMVTSVAFAGQKKDDNKPNLLYIFPDQYRLQALSLWGDPAYQKYINSLGDPVHTPNLDKLAKQSVVFSQACSTHPVSSPHRAMLMSGMYPHDNGIEDVNCKLGREQELKHDIVCFTDVLSQAGYETAYVGKTHWHKTEALFDKNGNYVGTVQEPGGHSIGPYDTYIPEGKSRHSNKYWYQHLNDNHFNPRAYSNQPDLIGGKKDGEEYRPHEFTSKKEADVIIKYLENKSGERDLNKPFSIMWSLNPPHPPYFSINDCDKEVFDTYYKDMSDNELLVRKNVDFSAKAGDYTAKNQKNIQMNAKVYFSLIKSVDDEIGRVLDALEKTGEYDNTIVVFTSDHGDMMGSHGLTGKNQIYSESFLVPFFIRYPKKIKPRVDNLLFGSVDIMPSLLGMMGLHDMIPATVAGKDYSDGMMTGKYKMNKKPSSALFLNQNSKGVRTNKYTYVVHKNGEYELYDDTKDPYQMKSLKFEDIPQKEVLELKRALGKWLKEAHDRWYNNKINNSLVIY